MAVPRRRTVVIEGPLAFQTRRLEAARNGECGLQIFNLPELAAHVAGGFSYPATKEILEPAIKASLDEGGFEELDGVRHLPGMIRAVARTLRRAWNADVELGELARPVGAPRIADLARIEQRLKRLLPQAALLPRDLRNAAIDHVHRAPAALGEVRLEGASWIAPLWRPLLNRLCRAVPTTWKAPAVADTTWFAGTAAKLELF